MNDDELREALGGRAAGLLSADQRNDLLRAARLRATEPVRRRFVPRIAGAIAGLAALLVLAVIIAPLLLSPPVARPTNTAVYESSAAASPTSSDGLRIYTAQELAGMIGDPKRVGRTVLAEASMTIGELYGLCVPPGRSCTVGTLDGVDGKNVVEFGWRDAATGTGQSYTDDTGIHWVVPVAGPTGPGIYAFTVGDDNVKYLGPAQLASGAPFDVTDVPSADERTPTDSVYIVSGWWWTGLWPGCPVPTDFNRSPRPNLEFYCNGSWISAERPARQTLPTDEGLELPAGLYPRWSDQHSPGEPVRGVYAVRSAGCQLTLDDRCPVWRLIDRLDDVAGQSPSPEPVPSSPTPSNGITVYSADDLADMVGDANWIGEFVLAKAAFDFPTNYGPCPPPDMACLRAALRGVEGVKSAVLFGWRDATAEDGVRVIQSDGYRWMKQLSVPATDGIFAFKVRSNYAEFLGPAYVTSAGEAVTVGDIQGISSSLPSDGVIAVRGWLTKNWPPPPCAAPPELLETPRPALDYYCYGTWLTPDQNASLENAVRVQNDAYELFSGASSEDENGVTPQFGTYLIRNAGCPVQAPCPSWRMVGRLDSTPPPDPAPEAPVGFVTAELNGVSFDYPADWHLNDFAEFQHYYGILGHVSSELANAPTSCGPNYQPGMGGDCTHTYELPEGSMMIRIDQYSFPGHGIGNVAYDLGSGWAPAVVGGLSGAYVDPYTDSGIAGHVRAWAVAPPADTIRSYTIIVTDNAYPDADAVIDRLVSSFTIKPDGSTRASIDEFNARNVASPFWQGAHESQTTRDFTVRSVSLGASPTTGRPAWIVQVKGTVTEATGASYISAMILAVDEETGAIELLADG